MRAHPAAVVGGTGFIGSRLVSELDRAGHPVAQFNRAFPPVVGSAAAPGLQRAGTVFFMAARLSPALAEQQPERIAVERKLLLDVLDALGRSGHRPVFVLASSGGTVYAPDACPPYAESASLGPTSAYGRAKLRLERELLARTECVQPVVMRLSNVYGPGQRPAPGYGVISHWLEAAARNEAVRLFGDPDVVRDYVHVDDVAEILTAVHRRVTAGEADGTPAVLNVGSGVPTSLAELLDTVRAVTGWTFEVIREHGRQFDQLGNWLDTRLAQTTLGWKARIGLPEGVRQCWHHVLARQAQAGDGRRPSGADSGSVAPGHHPGRGS